MTILDAAKKLVAHGFSPIPVESGSKKPKIAWKEFQVRRMSASELNQHFSNGARLGIACGEASGNLEVLDFDAPGFFEKWESSLPQGILDKCMVLSTPSGCKHVYYRLAHAPPGNQVLARTSDREIAIETRGHGGYVVSYPSEGYAVLRGNYKALHAISDDERETMFAVAYSLNEYYEPPRSYNPGVQRPGDAFNEKASWNELLEEEGWTHVGHNRGNDLWCRPGKTEGTSATCNGEYLYVFTSNAPPLTPGKAYKKFDFLVATDYNGDYFAAAQALGKQGYGSRPQRNYDNAVIAVSRAPVSWVALDDVEERDVDWLFYPYFPLSAVSMIYGDSGIGKSTSTYALCAGLSVGILPTKQKCEPIKSIILSAEDPADKVVRPRLRAMGADLSKMLVPKESDEGEPPFRLDDGGCLELTNAIREWDARVVVIDPLRSYFDGDNMDNQLQARAFMNRLNGIARATGAAMILVHHVNKNTMARGRYRASGSQDFFDACRSALMAIQDPHDQEHYALSHEKHNLSPRGDSLGYTFDAKGESPFTWIGFSDLTSELASAKADEPVSPKKVKACEEWLRNLLSSEGEVPTVEVFKGADLEGYSQATVKRAKAALGQEVKAIRIHSESGSHGKGQWSWRYQEPRDVWRGSND